MEAAGETGNCSGWAARDESGFMSPLRFDRRVPKSEDVSIKILYCGVCYADVVWTRNRLGNSMYPVVPGHEIVGVVEAVGSGVSRFKAGDHVGVGTFVDTCRDCDICTADKEHMCKKRVSTFNSVDADGAVTKGGYSSHIVVGERYCYRIPEGYPLAEAAPLLCAGITVYSPMKRHGMLKPGAALGVVGLGGLGHMAVKLGKAFGLRVTVLSRTEAKKEEALSLLAADSFVVSSDEEQMQSAAGSLDFIIDTASGSHPFDPYLALLKTEGLMVLVGASGEIRASPISLLIGSKGIFGSGTGSVKDAQELLEFCAAKGVHPKIEIIGMQQINEALERLIKSDVRYRFVIDIANTL